MALQAANPGVILHSEPPLSIREAAQRWREAMCLYLVVGEAEGSLGDYEPPITAKDRELIKKAQQEYEHVYCNGKKDKRAFERVKKMLLDGIGACRIDLHTSNLESAKAWRESDELALRLKQISDDQVKAATALKLQPKTSVRTGLALMNYVVPTQLTKIIKCSEDSSIAWLYSNVVAGGSNLEPHIRAYLLENAPEPAHTVDRLRWRPIAFSQRVAHLTQYAYKGNRPHVVFVSRGCEHIVTIVGEARTQAGGFGGAALDAVRGAAGLRMVDSAVILVPDEAPGRDLDDHIRKAANIPIDRNVQYIISDSTHSTLGLWGQGMRPAHLSPYTSNNYAVISGP